jgi:amino acid permease
MIGSGIVTLPWTFMQSGILVGIIISFISFVVSLRTCILVNRVCGPNDDFYDTAKKYWGTSGYYLAMVGTLLII